jgi:hypothetical protein
MTLSSLGRASAIGVAILLLVGCGGSSQEAASTPFAPPAAQQDAHHGRSWMLPEAKGEALIYAVGGCGGTCVLSYPKGKLVGELPDVDGGGACTEDNGNVFISEQTEVAEFAHGGSSPIATFQTPSAPPVGCSVDRNTGTLAVVNNGSVTLFPVGSQTPATYNTLLNAQYCGYDDAGNLFVNGFDGQSIGLSELPNGSQTFEKLTIDQSVGIPGQMQWDGEYLTYESQSGSQPTIAQLSVAGSDASVVSQTVLKRVPDALALSWIYRGTVVAPYSRQGPHRTSVGIWKYPKGSSMKRVTNFGSFHRKLFHFNAAVVSAP